MICFQPITIEYREPYNRLLAASGRQGCENGFTNLFLWGRQRMAFVEGNAVVFSQYDRKSVYLFPAGKGDLKKTIDLIIHDACVRDIPCRLAGLTEADCRNLESLYPGRFRFHIDRNSFDYVYSIDDLADLAGRKFQRKRNHLNRFLQQYPDWSAEPVDWNNLQPLQEMLEQWYAVRQQQDPTRDFHMEKAAIKKALTYGQELGLEGLVLRVNGHIVAVTLASPLTEDTFDIHFEKAFDSYDGAYAAINRTFARHLREKYPNLSWLNREEDMGIEGLRQAKLSYQPARMNEKYWACLLEDGYDY